MIDTEGLSPERKAIIRIGESIDCCYPGPFAYVAYPVFYLALQKEHPEIAERLLNAATDEGRPPELILSAIKQIVADLS